MDPNTQIWALFGAGIAFLMGSVYYNRKTGWKRAAKRDELSSFLLWCSAFKAGVKTDWDSTDKAIGFGASLEALENSVCEGQSRTDMIASAPKEAREEARAETLSLQ